jgi:ABC-type antimicrobial peptide transport system permease subunit
VVTRLAPSLTATLSPFSGGGKLAGGPPGAIVTGNGPSPLGQTVSVALHAPISVALIVLAIGLSLAGGIVAGVAGGWRASRMRPADAMRQVA